MTDKKVSDEELLFAARKGDEKAFAALYERFSKHAFFVALECCKMYHRFYLDESEVKLVMLDTFYACYLRFKKSANSRFYTYWRKSCDNAFNNYITANYSLELRGSRAFSLNEPHDKEGNMMKEDVVGENDESVLHFIAHHDLTIIANMTRFSPEEKQMLNVILEGKDRQESAERFHWTNEKSSKIYSRIVKKLRATCIAKNYEGH